MPEFRARSRSVSIPSAPNSLNTFSGRGHSLIPPPKNEQVSFPGVQTLPNGSAHTSSHWTTLSNHFRSSRTKSMATPRAPEVLQAAPRQRTIVRKSLRIPEVTKATVDTPFPTQSKPEEVDSDDEGTLVSVSGAEMPTPNNEVIEKKFLEEDKRPAKQSARVSRKILPVIPDVFDDPKDLNRSSMQEPQERVIYNRKSQLGVSGALLINPSSSSKKKARRTSTSPSHLLVLHPASTDAKTRSIPVDCECVRLQLTPVLRIKPF